jgi:heme oxygenase
MYCTKGGQMMGGMATRSLDLEDGNGVAFYTFDDIPSPNIYITGWYDRLNGLDLTDEQKNEIVDEANFVFDLNIGILQELEGSPMKAIWTLTVNSLKQKLGLA